MPMFDYNAPIDQNSASLNEQGVRAYKFNNSILPKIAGGLSLAAPILGVIPGIGTALSIGAKGVAGGINAVGAGINKNAAQLNNQPNDAFAQNQQQYGNAAKSALTAAGKGIAGQLGGIGDITKVTPTGQGAVVNRKGYGSFNYQPLPYMQNTVSPFDLSNLDSAAQFAKGGKLLGFTGGHWVYANGGPTREDGGMMNGPSHEQGGIDLINSQTGQKVGEAQGKERIFSRGSTRKMEKLAKAGNHAALGKLIASEIAKQDKLQGKTTKAVGGIKIDPTSPPEGYSWNGAEFVPVVPGKPKLDPYGNPKGGTKPTPQPQTPFPVPENMEWNGYGFVPKTDIPKVTPQPNYGAHGAGLGMSNAERMAYQQQNNTTAPAPASKQTGNKGATQAPITATAQSVRSFNYKPLPYMQNQAVPFDLAGAEESLVAPAPTTPTGTNGLPEGIGTSLAGLGQLGLGLYGASRPINTNYTLPAQYSDYLNRTEQQSYSGFTAPETALYRNTAERAYRYDVSNITNKSGGSGGVALGNLGRAAGTLSDANLRLAALNANLQRQNLAQYGNAMNPLLNAEYGNFQRQYQQQVATRQAAAGLANTGLNTLIGQNQYNQAYGKGSIYAQGQQAQTNYLNAETDLLRAQTTSPLALSSMAPRQSAIPLNQNYQFDPNTGLRNPQYIAR